MRALICQYCIAFVFLGLGGWALFAPQSVVDLAITPQYREGGFLLLFTMACFGAQAVMFGIMALVVRWSSRAFATFALVLIPFFAFNYYFHYEMPVLTSLGMLDFVGNLIMFIACLIGWRAARVDEQDRRGLIQ